MLVILTGLIRWMPVILFVLLLLLDRENFTHVVAYIILLLSYTLILVAKILHAKNEWHNDPKTSKISGDMNIQKMSDFLEKMEELSEEE